MTFVCRPSAWLFCRIIDNYGDIGVALRLAACLAEYGFQVALWHDHPVSADLLTGGRLPDRVRLHHWQGGAEESVAAELQCAAPVLVAEMFACDLPAAAEAVIRNHRPLWLNWEYLCAEDWAERLHGSPSLHRSGAEKYFWLMGFSPKSGGLLRERDYEWKRQRFLADPAAQAQARQRLRLPSQSLPDAEKWFCFGYRSPVWAQWLAVWQQADTPRECWLAGGQIIDSLHQSGLLPPSALQRPGDVWQRGRLRLVHAAFVPQRHFDAALWLADALIVRGEDSFVRAQWAGKPLLWHIYPQDEQVHAAKLHAFWQKAAPPPRNWQPAHRLLSDSLNGLTAADAAQTAAAWASLSAHMDDWRQDTENWRAYLAAQTDSVGRLLQRWPSLQTAVAKVADDCGKDCG